MADGSSASDTGVIDVIDSVDSVDTGSSTSPEVVSLDQNNVPSVINNNGSSDANNVPAPDFTVPGGNTLSNQAALNNIVSSEVTSANADYNPFDLVQLFDSLAGIDGPTQVNNGAGNSNSKVATGSSGGTIPLGNLLKNVLGSGNSSTSTTGAVKSKPVVIPQQSPSTDALSKFLLGNPSSSSTAIGGININNLALLLTVITSLIIIWLFIKKGR